MKLSCHDRLNQVPFVTKTIQDNNMTDHTCAVYDENDTELLWSIGLGMVCHEQYSKNDVTGHTCAVYSQNEIKLSWLIELCAIYEENQIEQQCD